MKEPIGGRARLLGMGPALSKGAPQEQRLRWLRRGYTRVSLPTLLFLALVLVFAGMRGWALVLFGGFALITLCGLALISVQIRRTRRTESTSAR